MTDYFTRLERELVAAVQRTSATAAPARRARTRRRRRVVVTLAAALALIGVPAGAAVTGVFTPKREGDGLVRLSERKVIATGTISRGRWTLLTSRSDVGFCLGMRLPPELPGMSSTVGEGCGGAEPGTLTVASSSGGSARNRAVVWGMTPDDAARVAVRTDGAEPVTANTIEDQAGLAGRFYVVELPVRTGLGPTTVTALDASGQRIGVVQQNPSRTRPELR
jgi:hypothetical protein